MWGVTILGTTVSKRTESTRTVSSSPIEPYGRPRGKINRDEFSQDLIWGAPIRNRNASGSSLDDATDEALVRAIQGERAPQAHGYFMISYRRYADRMYQNSRGFHQNLYGPQLLPVPIFRLDPGAPCCRQSRPQLFSNPLEIKKSLETEHKGVRAPSGRESLYGRQRTGF